jgi:hypothetical protein
VLHQEVPNIFTFACLSGVIGKCAKWKYLPWEVPDMNWACTRAARADYCGTGETHTLENTPVGVYDSHDPPFRTEAVATAADAGKPLGTFESAWTTTGAFCVTHARWPQLIDKAGTQLCGKSTPIIDQTTGQPYLCGSLNWAIQQEPKHDPPISGPLIAIDSGYNTLPQ